MCNGNTALISSGSGNNINPGVVKVRTFISVSEQKGNLGIGLVRRVEDKNLV